MLSIYGDNYAFFDEKSNKIKMRFDSKIASITIPEGRQLTFLKITDKKLMFILDQTHFVRGDLNQDLERPMFKSVDNIPENRKWSSILFVAKEKFAKTFLVARDPDTNNHEIFMEEDGTWRDVSANVDNIVEKIPKTDWDLSVFIVSYMLGKVYYGVYDEATKKIFWQSPIFPSDKLHCCCIGKNFIYSSEINEGKMSVYKTDIQKMLNNENGASKKISEDVYLSQLLICEDTGVFTTLSEHVALYTDDKLLCFSAKLEEDDCFIHMDNYKHDFLFGTLKGRIFKCRFNDAANGLVFFREIHPDSY